MRRQRLVGLGIVSFLLLALTLICASASWFIQDRKSQEAAYKDAALGNATATTKSDYFTLDYTYSGAKKVPQLTTAGVTLFGYSTVEGNFEFEWLGGTDKSGNVLTGSTPEKYQGVIAGTHRYKVVEVATGQTIYDNLQITVNKATLTVGSLSASSDPTFVAGTVAYTYQINGVSGHSMEYTDSATVPYDAFTAGASITTSYDGMTAVFDPAKLTLPTLSDSNFTINSNNYNKPASTVETAFTCTVLPTCYSVEDGAPTFYGSLNQALYELEDTTTTTTLVAMASFSYNNKVYAVDGVGTATVKTSDEVTNPTAAVSVNTATAVKKYKHILGGTADTVYGGDKTINSSITLLVPYATSGTLSTSLSGDEGANHTTNKKDGVSYDRYAVNGGLYANAASDTKAPASRYTPKPISLNKVSLESNLTNNGTILICGRTGYTYPTSGVTNTYSATNAVAQGSTTGFHATLEMGAGTTITMQESSAQMDVFGYVVESSTTAASILAQKGTINAPFCVYDYNGGGYTVGLYQTGKLAPFSTFDMPNIQTTLTVNGGTTGAEIHAYTSIYTGSFSGYGMEIEPKYNFADFTILADSGALFNITDGTATFRYTSANSYADAYNASKGYRPARASKTVIELDGTTASGDIAMTIDTGVPLIGSVDVSLATVHFPISDKIRLYLGSGKAYTFTTPFKLLPGSQVHIIENSSVTIASSSEMLIYKKWNTSSTSLSTRFTSNEAFSRFYDRTGAATDALLNVVRGTLTVSGKIAGTITAGGEGATLNLASTSALSITQQEGNGGFMEFSKTGEESRSANAYTMIRNDLADNKPLEKNMYYSQGYSKGGSTTYAWRPATATISFEPNGGTLSTTSVSGLSIDANGIVGSFTPNETYVPTLDVEGVTFLGWYMDDELTIPFDKTKVAGSLTLYAKWSKEMYKVVFNANVGTKEIDINFGNKMIIDGYYPTLPNWSTDAPLGEDKDTDTDITKKYYFVGWASTPGATTPDVTADNLTSFINSKRAENAASGADDTIQLYAIWGVKHTLTVSLKQDGGTASITVDGSSTVSGQNVAVSGTHYLNPRISSKIETYVKGYNYIITKKTATLTIDGSQKHSGTDTSDTYSITVTAGGNTTIVIVIE